MEQAPIALRFTAAGVVTHEMSLGYLAVVSAGSLAFARIEKRCNHGAGRNGRRIHYLELTFSIPLFPLFPILEKHLAYVSRALEFVPNDCLGPSLSFLLHSAENERKKGIGGSKQNINTYCSQQ